MKNLIFATVLPILGFVSNLQAETAPIYLPADYVDATKAYMHTTSAKLDQDSFALVLVSLVEGMEPKVFRLREFDRKSLKPGIMISDGNEDSFLRGRMVAKFAQSNAERTTVDLSIHYRAKTLIRDDKPYVPGSNLEANLDVNLRPREIVLLAAEASRDHGVATGSALLIVRGG